LSSRWCSAGEHSRRDSRNRKVKFHVFLWESARKMTPLGGRRNDIVDTTRSILW
jgi:hypothetical protein